MYSSLTVFLLATGLVLSAGAAVDLCKDKVCGRLHECRVVTSPDMCISSPCNQVQVARCVYVGTAGRCPFRDDSYGPCKDYCANDLSCPSGLKCCPIGCSKQCVMPKL
ncbi:uncharacterized protein LOC141907898 [Tubulanus polymorphus]|uniref:uncharacterized protein LOC141907898 n=1 Tax=Tubulanus polymorphus TaxID=672921 RepID=UPI003DA48C32